MDEAFDSEAIAATGAELNIGIPKDLQMDAADTRTMCKDNRRICPRYINRCHNTWVQNLCPKTCGKCVGDTMTATATTTTATKPPGASKCKDFFDFNNKCPFHKEMGHCTQPLFLDAMHRFCRKSCGFCI